MPVPSITTTTTSSPTSVTPLSVKPMDMDTLSFLKYANTNLKEKWEILNVYDNICVHALRFNVSLRPSSQIIKIKGVVHDNPTDDSRAVIATALYSKFSQANTISSSYKNALNILDTTTDGYAFIQIFLRQVHPLLVNKNIFTANISKFSTSCNLYQFAKELGQYVKNHGLKSCFFSDKKNYVHVFDSIYMYAVKHCDTVILSHDVVDEIYRMPSIVGIINQLQP